MAGSRGASIRSTRSNRSLEPESSHERTPLLSENGDGHLDSYTQPDQDDYESPAARSLQSLKDGHHGTGKGGPRWVTLAALSTLVALTLAILCIGFAAPAAVEEYVKEALVVEPTKLSIDSFTSTGVKARVQAIFTLDASKVHTKSLRDFGKMGTYIAKEIETGESNVKVYLPAYDNLLLGIAKIPPVKVNIRNGHVNHIDILADLEPGHVDGIRSIANEWLGGRLGRLEVKGVATLDLKSGIFKLGSQTISQSMVLEGHDLPAFPEFNVSKLNFHEIEKPSGSKLMAAEASVSIMNDYPVHLDVPGLSFDILVANCLPQQDYLLLARAETEEVEIRPKENVNVSVVATVKHLPDSLTTACPGSNSSPLDVLLGGYIQGQDTIIYVRGSDSPSKDTPSWISDIIKSVTVPLPFPGHSFDNLIRNFSLTNVHFSLPNPMAEPDEPDSKPRISTIVKALVGLPEEMNFSLDVNHVRADADVYYHGNKLGELDLHKWQTANSTRVEDSELGHGLLIESTVTDAPLTITNDTLFTEVVQSLLFGSQGIVLGVKAKIDVEADTALGDFIVREVPADGKVIVKPLTGGVGFSEFKPTFGDLKILETSKKTLTLQAKVNVTNPTVYSAYVPYFSINVLNNDTVLGHVTAKDLSVIPGNNTNLLVELLWNPVEASGKNGSKVARELISQYISGFNTTLTLKTHENSIPSQPALGKALSAFEITIDTPRLKPPVTPGDGGDGEEDDERPHFIQDATMHLFSSTATFVLWSPLPNTTLYITSISAVALYNHTEPVGTIDYDLPIKIPPGISTTPRLPVAWSLGGTGYDAVRDALGGTLKLDAKADAGVRIYNWEEQIWFMGSGIGAHIQL